MRELVEMIGKRNGISSTDIWNQLSLIDANIAKLVEGELNVSTDTIILLAIEYSLSLKLQMQYKNILNFAQDKLN